MFKSLFKFFIGVIIALNFVGCDSKTVYNPAEKISAEAAIPSDKFEAGEVKDNVSLPVTSPDGKKVAEVAIPAGTTFTDENGNPVSEAPKTAVKVEKAPEVTKVELKFVDKNGNPLKVDGSNPIEAKVPAPRDAKPGDRVEIEVPNGVEASDDISDFQVSAKKISAIVGADGFVTLKIFPSALINGSIDVEVKIPITTGAEGA